MVLEIPYETARRLCVEIRSKRGKMLRPIQCWGCMRFSNCEPDKMCFTSNKQNAGCRLVNKLYLKRYMGDRGRIRI